ncbi:MAG: response regulator, partial [Desulfobulbaceae bacterium]|nr:response regulator [Desulfobulbaceae bacterium]
MENTILHLLILEDNPDDAELAVMELKREGFTLEWTRVDTEQGFKEALAGMPDLILVDYALPSFDGVSALQVHRQLAPEIPLIIFSGTIGEEVAVECMKSGAMDYVFKDRISRLGPVVKRALKEAKADRVEKQAQEALEENEKHFNTILNSIQTGIVAIDAETHEIIYANPAAVKIIGAPKEQIIGHVCNKYICPAAKGSCPITDLG